MFGRQNKQTESRVKSKRKIECKIEDLYDVQYISLDDDDDDDDEEDGQEEIKVHVLRHPTITENY